MVKDKKKLWIPVIAAVCILVLGIAAFLIWNHFSMPNDKVKEPKDGDITRYEWMEMLCEQEGITEYENIESYYPDVVAGNVYYSYIQSAVEWEVLNASGAFEGDLPASGKFIALTAMKTIGQEKIRLYLKDDKDITEKVYLELAEDNGLVEEEQFTRGFSKEECEQVLAVLKDLQFGKFWKDDYADIVYRDGVVELSSRDVVKSNADGSEILVTKQVADSLEVGNRIVFEQKSTGLKMAREVREINSDGTLLLDPAELDEVAETLVVSDIAELTFNDIVNYYGLKETDIGKNNLNNWQASENFVNTKVFSMQKNSKGFKISLSTDDEERLDDEETGQKESDENEADQKDTDEKEAENKEKQGEMKNLSVAVTDNETGTSYTLPIDVRIKSKNDYSAEIDIDKICVGAQVNYSRGVQYADAAVDVHAAFSGEIQAEEEKKIPLFKTPVPLGNGLIGVEVQINVILSIDGSISFETEFPVQAAVCYEKGKGLRNLKQEASVENPRIEANCDVSAFLRIEPVLVVLDCCRVLDVEADTGITASANVVSHPDSQICADISASFPVITISVCADDEDDTLIGSLGLFAEWEIITSEHAPFQPGMHYEYLADNTSQFVDKCTYNEDGAKTKEDDKENKEDKDTGEEDEKEEDKDDEKESEDKENKATDLSRFYGYNLPLSIFFDYEEQPDGSWKFFIEDYGDYFIADVTLFCAECAGSECVYADIGEHFVTGSGRGYTVVGEESYSNDQRQKRIFLGDDGETYEVSNLPAPSGVDIYTWTPYYILVKQGETACGTYFEDVKIRLPADLPFSDGETVGGSFGEYVRSGAFEEFPDDTGLAHDFNIHFTEDGTIDIFTDIDFQNGEWRFQRDMEIWRKKLK